MFDEFQRDRDAAIYWARQTLDRDFVVLDTETTGLEHHDVAVQIGIIDKAGAVLLDSLVKPWKRIPAKATAIHGITNAMVQDAPTILELEPALSGLLRGKFVLIYNAPYDTRILAQSFIYDGLSPLPDNHWCYYGNLETGCVMARFAQFYGEWNDYRQSYKWQKLTLAARHFGLSAVGAHGAAADALMTLRVLEGMAKARTSEEENVTNQPETIAKSS